MSAPEESTGHVQALVEALAEGEPVDWDLAESEAEEGEEREQVRALRAIERVRRAFSTWHTDEGSRSGREDASEKPALEPGSCWGDLEILDRLGRGSFGDVYRARDPHLDRIVALKLIRRLARRDATPPTDEGGRESRERRAIREGQLLARIRHENVVTVFGAAQHEGRIGLWMEYLEGKTLADLLREQGPFSAREAAGIGIDVCRALAAVHAEGILHRDVKAQNVMRAARGRIVLTDFGIGRELAEAHEEHSLSGTPLYLAPEVLAGSVATVSSDLYSVGVLLYYLTTGNYPVEGSSLGEIRRAHERSETHLLRDARPDLPEGFVEVVEKALSLDPKERYTSAGAFERALVKWSTDHERGIVRRTSSPPLWKRLATMIRNPAVSLVLATTLVLGLASVFSSVGLSRAFFLLSEIEAHFGNGRQALRSLDRAVSLDPEYATAWVRKSQLLSEAGRLAETLAAEDKAYALRYDLVATEKHIFLGLYHSDRTQISEAIKEYQKAVDLDASNESGWRAIAWAYTALGDYEGALDVAKEVARKNPRTRGGLNDFIVGSLVALGRSDEAMEVVQAAKKNSGATGDEFHFGEGLVLMERGEFSAAEKAFELSMRPEQPGANVFERLFVAQIHVLTGRLADARQFLETSIAFDPRHGYPQKFGLVATRIQIGELSLLCGDKGKARILAGELEGVLWTLPQMLPDFRATALLAIDAGNLELTLRLEKRVRKIIAGYPSDYGRAIAAQLRGEIALQRGQARPAREALEEAYQYRQDLPIARSLALAWIAEGRYDRAVELLEEIERSEGRALRECRAALWLRSKLDLARCLVKVGRLDEARTTYDGFLGSWRSDRIPLVRQARAERARI